MSGSNLREALARYATPLQTALHCVTAARLRHSAGDADATSVLLFPSELGVELRRMDSTSGNALEPIWLKVQEHLDIMTASTADAPRTFRPVASGYRYTIEDRNHREVLTFHWHPGQRSHEQDPLLHVGSGVIDSGAGDLGKTFSSLHIPTERVALARIVRMLITEFQVVPNRQDWERVLERLLVNRADR